jgi:hypothetical protein
MFGELAVEDDASPVVVHPQLAPVARTNKTQFMRLAGLLHPCGYAFHFRLSTPNSTALIEN